MKDEISQLKNKKTKIVYILKVRDKMSQLKNKRRTSDTTCGGQC